MASFFETCIPTRGTKVPAGPDWHQTRRLPPDCSARGKRVRLFTRNGYDWSDRYPLITEAALRNRNTSFLIDGEAVLLGVDCISDFDGLHSRKHDDEVQFYAFDCLVSDGEDIRKLPLSMRKANLSGSWRAASMASSYGARPQRLTRSSDDHRPDRVPKENGPSAGTS
jgi:hypothetical protein